MCTSTYQAMPRWRGLQAIPRRVRSPGSPRHSLTYRHSLTCTHMGLCSLHSSKACSFRKKNGLDHLHCTCNKVMKYRLYARIALSTTLCCSSVLCFSLCGPYLAICSSVYLNSKNGMGKRNYIQGTKLYQGEKLHQKTNNSYRDRTAFLHPPMY